MYIFLNWRAWWRRQFKAPGGPTIQSKCRSQWLFITLPLRTAVYCNINMYPFTSLGSLQSIFPLGMAVRLDVRVKEYLSEWSGVVHVGAIGLHAVWRTRQMVAIGAEALKCCLLRTYCLCHWDWNTHMSSTTAWDTLTRVVAEISPIVTRGLFCLTLNTGTTSA